MPVTAPAEIPIPATVKLPESLWKRAKIEAIRDGITLSDFVKQSLEATLASREEPRRLRNGRGGDDGGGR